MIGALFLALMLSGTPTPAPTPTPVPGLGTSFPGVTWGEVTPGDDVRFFLGTGKDGQVVALGVCKGGGCELYFYVEFVKVKPAPPSKNSKTVAIDK